MAPLPLLPKPQRGETAGLVVNYRRGQPAAVNWEWPHRAKHRCGVWGSGQQVGNMDAANLDGAAQYGTNTLWYSRDVKYLEKQWQY